ncbi:uncharacterized protein [Aphelocoma coerulescens]|uniref:uncharacterized protein n=1 Tax=Aphelocoma coerulescens TaxID=39617 RepID=UPI0036050DFC
MKKEKKKKRKRRCLGAKKRVKAEQRRRGEGRGLAERGGEAGRGWGAGARLSENILYPRDHHDNENKTLQTFTAHHKLKTKFQVQMLKLPVTLALKRKFPAAPSQLPGMAPSLRGLPIWCRALGAVGSGTVGAWFLLCPRDRKPWGEVCTGEAKHLSDDPLISCCFHCSVRQVLPVPHRAVVHLCSLSMPKMLTLSWASHPAAHPAQGTALLRAGLRGLGPCCQPGLLPAPSLSRSIPNSQSSCTSCSLRRWSTRCWWRCCTRGSHGTHSCCLHRVLCRGGSHLAEPHLPTLRRRSSSQLDGQPEPAVWQYRGGHNHQAP